MNKKIIKVMSVGLCAATLVPSLVYAKQFKDVTANGPYNWAYKNIDVLSDKGIVYGYTDGTYRPKNSVSFEEIQQLLKGIINPTSIEIENAVKKYTDVMDKYKVSTWAREAVAVALDKNVIDEDVLSNANKSKMIGVDVNKQINPSRSNIAVFYAKALKLSANGDENLLKHSDKSQIPAVTRGYLASLVKAGVFTATGGDGDKFDGNRPITRAEMATITKLAYDYKNKEKETKTTTGKVLFAEHINNRDVIVLEIGKDKQTYTVDSSTVFKMDGKLVKFEDIKEGQEVKLTYTTSDGDSAGNATIVDITNSEKNLIGYIDVASIGNNKISIDYTENNDKLDQTGVTRFSTTKRETFEFASNAKIYKLGKLINQSQLTYGDMIEFKTDSNGKISELFSYPKSGNVTATVKDIVNATVAGQRDKLVLTVDNKEFTLYSDPYDANDPYRTRSSVSGVRKGDKVTLDTQYKAIVRSNSIVESGSVNSYVTSVVKGWDGSVTLYVNSVGYRTNANTTLNGRSNIAPREFEDLNGKYVSLTFNGDYIKNINTVKYGRNEVVGKVISSYPLNSDKYVIEYFPKLNDGTFSNVQKSVTIYGAYQPIFQNTIVTIVGDMNSQGEFINNPVVYK